VGREAVYCTIYELLSSDFNCLASALVSVYLLVTRPYGVVYVANGISVTEGHKYRAFWSTARLNFARWGRRNVICFMSSFWPLEFWGGF